MDIFNPKHYIPRIYLEEESKPKVVFDLTQFLEERKFRFSSLEKYLILEQQNLSFLNTKSYLLITSNELNNHVDIENSTLIIEAVGLEKNVISSTLNIKGKCEIYLLTNNKSEQLSYHNMEINLDKNSQCNFFIIHRKHEQKSKYDMTFNLQKESQLDVHGFADISNNQYQDDSIIVNHQKNSHSNISYRSLTNGFLVTQVNSVIPKEASEVSTEQHLKHTMLSEKAKIFSKPNLEISNPNVTASHGNSIGSFDDDYLFYLEQRGVQKERATALLLESEADNFLNNTSFSNELKQYLKEF